LRLVDPKYVRTAAEERVEGTVRLFGVIRKDGSVDSVELLRRLDPRLDAAAAEALAKWKFTPALRGEVPVEVDAVFEVPFHLTPRTAQ
jgi:protein TonB